MNISEFNVPQRVDQHLEDIIQWIGKHTQLHVQVVASYSYLTHDDVPRSDWTLYINFQAKGHFNSLQRLVAYLEDWLEKRPYREILFRKFSIPSNRYRVDPIHGYRLAA